MQAIEYPVLGEIALTSGSLLRVEDGRGVVLYVWEGELWITQEGERRDHYLSAGDWLRLDRDGAAIAQALDRTHMSLTAPQPEHYARRIALARAGTVMPLELYPAGRAESLAERLRRTWAQLFAPRSRPTSAAL